MLNSMSDSTKYTPDQLLNTTIPDIVSDIIMHGPIMNACVCGG